MLSGGLKEVVDYFKIFCLSFQNSNGQSVNNDGLTKQQLDLIHQIMQQTQQQAASQQKQQKTVSSTNTVSSNSVTNVTSKANTPNKTKTWTVQVSFSNIRQLKCLFT